MAYKPTTGTSIIDNDFKLVTSEAVYEALAFKQDTLPVQTGNEGAFLITNGSTLSWSNTAAEFRVTNYRLDPSKHSHTQSSTGSHTINWANAPAQVITLNGSITSLTLSNPVEGGSYFLKLVQGAGGGPYTVTWPSGVKWGVGAPPVLTTSANGIDIISFVYLDGEYYGTYSLGFA